MQGRIILNRNSNFQFWTGGIPDNYNQNGFAVIQQLDRHLPRSHPYRQVFPKKLKAHDLVQNGDFALRFFDGSGGDDGAVQTPSVAVAPGMEISVSIMYRYDAVPGDNVQLRLVLYDDIAQTTEIARVRQPVSANVEGTIPPKLVTHMIGNPASYELAVGDATAAVVVDDPSGPSLRPPYWRRHGVSFEVPAGVGAMTAEFVWTGATIGDACDVDDFRIEALNSRVHAGG